MKLNLQQLFITYSSPVGSGLIFNYCGYYNSDSQIAFILRKLRFATSFLSINPSNLLFRSYELQTRVRWVYITFIYQLLILLLVTSLYFIPTISNLLASTKTGWLILFGVVLIIGVVNLVASRGLINVFVIKKDWINQSEAKDKIVEISGKRPIGENGNLAFL